jgi:hypothetical protein
MMMRLVAISALAISVLGSSERALDTGQCNELECLIRFGKAQPVPVSCKIGPPVTTCFDGHEQRFVAASLTLAQPIDACTAPTMAGVYTNRWILAERGNCDFSTKVKHATAGGAAGVVLYLQDDAELLVVPQLDKGSLLQMALVEVRCYSCVYRIDQKNSISLCSEVLVSSLLAIWRLHAWLSSQ